MKIEIEYKYLNFIKMMLTKKYEEYEVSIKKAYSDSETPLSEINRLNGDKDTIGKILKTLNRYNEERYERISK